MDKVNKLQNVYNKVLVLINTEVNNVFKQNNDNLKLITDNTLNNLIIIFKNNNITFDENLLKVFMFDNVTNQLTPELSLLIQYSKESFININNSLYSFILNNISLNEDEYKSKTKNYILNNTNNINNNYNYNILSNIWNNFLDILCKNINTNNKEILSLLSNQINDSINKVTNLFNTLDNNYKNIVLDYINKSYIDFIDNKEENISNLEILNLDSSI
jgi:hypothetical protein